MNFFPKQITHHNIILLFSRLLSNLDRYADDDEKEVGRRQAGEESVGRGTHALMAGYRRYDEGVPGHPE